MAYRDMTTGAYPVTRDELIARHPDREFPEVWDRDLLDFLGVDEVEPSEPPEIPHGFVLVEAPPGYYGIWRQRWTLVALPENERPPPTPDLSEADQTWT